MNDYELIIKEAIKELDQIMETTPAQAAKDVVKRAIGRSVRVKDPMFWPSGMLMLGLTAAIENEEGELSDKAKASIDRHIKLWKDDYGSKLRFVDDSVAGFCAVRLYEIFREDRYREFSITMGDFLNNAKTDNLGGLIYNSGKGNVKIFADGIGQATLFWAALIRMKLREGEESFESETKNDYQYYSESDYVALISKIYTQFIYYYTYGRDSKSGLLYHGYEVHVDTKTREKEITCNRHGLIGWGRAHGWILLGLSEAACLEKELRKRLRPEGMAAGFDLIPWYKELCEQALEYQREDGGWSWMMQAVDGHIDMSATGMIAYSMAKGIEAGLFEDNKNLQERIKDSLLKAKESMKEHSNNGIVTDALGECEDFAVHYQNYGNFPWGQGSVLAALYAIDRIM